MKSNIEKLGNSPIMVSYLAEGSLNINFGYDAKGNIVYFNPKDAEKVKSKRIYTDSNGDYLPNYSIRIGLEKRNYHVNRAEQELVDLLKNHPNCLGSKYFCGFALFKIVDEFENKKQEIKEHNLRTIAMEVYINLQASKTKDYEDILYILGYGDSVPLMDLANKNPEKFLSYFEPPKDKPNSNGIKYAELKDRYRVEANLKRAINKGVVTTDDVGILYFDGKKIGISIDDAIVALMNDSKENGKASIYPLILQKTKSI